PGAGRRGHRRGDPRRLMPDDCLFCGLYRDGDHVAATDGLVAIRDLHPQAETHLLVLPERHVESFHDIAEFPAGASKRMLEFMPEPLSEDELEEIVDDAIAENGATGMSDFGRVMADVMPQVSGRADGSVVSQLVREKLA